MAVALAVWRPDRSPPPAPPFARRALIQPLLGVALGAAMFFFFHWRVLGSVCAGLSAVVLATLLLSPRRGYPLIQRVFHGLGLAVGTVLNVVLLGAVYLVFFVPFGLLLRRGRRDRLQRRFRAPTPSYWRQHVAAEDAEAYERQA
jgi:hypothetical protein